MSPYDKFIYGSLVNTEEVQIIISIHQTKSRVIDINLKSIIRKGKSYNVQYVSSSVADVQWIELGITQVFIIFYTN